MNLRNLSSNPKIPDNLCDFCVAKKQKKTETNKKQTKNKKQKRKTTNPKDFKIIGSGGCMNIKLIWYILNNKKHFPEDLRSRYYLKMEVKEAGVRSVLWKVFFEISQNSQERTCAGVFFNKIAGLTFFHRTPLVAASEANVLLASRAYFYEAKVKFSNICEWESTYSLTDITSSSIK